MIISIASGKGGTGKTFIATNLASSIENVQIIDCDVEEPNVYLFLKPKIEKRSDVLNFIPEVDDNLCDGCGECQNFCEFNAIIMIKEKPLIFPELCHNCGGCRIICKLNAIKETYHKVGTIFEGKNNSIDIVFGELEIGEPVATNVIREVKKKIDKNKNVIIDSPPGSSCSFVESVKGSDFTILVTEPTPFGLHDLKITVDVLRKMNISFAVIINRSGLGDKNVYKYCENEKIPILLEIPYDRKIAEIYSKGELIISYFSEYKNQLIDVYKKIKEMI